MKLLDAISDAESAKEIEANVTLNVEAAESSSSSAASSPPERRRTHHQRAHLLNKRSHLQRINLRT